jgi:hypothetical protein
MMSHTVRSAAAWLFVVAWVGVPMGAADAQPSRDDLKASYLVLIDDNCPNQRVALAFPRDAHLKLKNAIKSETGGAYPAAAKEFETNTKVVGTAGACGEAIRKAQENGANTTNLVPAKEFFAQQQVAMQETAQLRFADDYCKKLVVDWKAQNERLEKLGLDPNARRVKGIVKKMNSDLRSRHRYEPAPFCLELYGKWSPPGLLKTKE